MLSDAQLTANRTNAQFSTGPRTAEGKASTARNGVTLGLFAARDLVLPTEQPDYDELRATLELELLPVTALERTHAMEILHASWRLRRCGIVEANLARSGVDPMENPGTASTQFNVDRARAQARNNLRRASEDLSRLQTERQYRRELDPSGEPGPDGLISHQNLAKALALDARRQVTLRKLKGEHNLDDLLLRAARQAGAQTPNEQDPPEEEKAPEEKSPPEITKQTQPLARSAPCPCGSGHKYKRCCGRLAPGQVRPVIRTAPTPHPPKPTTP